VQPEGLGNLIKIIHLIGSRTREYIYICVCVCLCGGGELLVFIKRELFASETGIEIAYSGLYKLLRATASRIYIYEMYTNFPTISLYFPRKIYIIRR
jgi:hypothetical protein